MGDGVVSPADIGLPPKFSSWRRGQWEAVEAALYSERRFVICCAPTGFGKSLVYLAQAKATGMRTVILTSTKGLQDQLISDFGAVGLVDVRGMNNYECLDVYLPGKKVRCDEGPCHAGYRCALKSGGCLYYDAVRKAKESQLVVTNYAYWMTARQVGIELGEVDLLVLDEAHNAPDELSSFLHVEIQAHEAEGVLGTRFPEVNAEQDTVRDWAAYHGRIVRERLEAIKQGMHEGQGPKNAVYEAKVLRDLGRKLDFLAKMRGEWVMERHERSMHWDPVWPGEYAEGYLFAGIEHVVLVSATVRPKTAHLLNIPASDWEFREYPSSFPVERRPVIHVPTVRMNRRTPPGEIKMWLARIDQLIGKRLDRKGIIHTVSYRRRNEIMAASEYKGVMVSHESRNTAAAVHNFKSMKPPAIFVSPSVGTGYDFPYDQVEFQIVGKIPFPDVSTAVMKARTREDPEYTSYLAMQALIQMCGRGMRAEDDRLETLVIDDSMRWFVWKYKDFAPKWWLDSVRWVRSNPEPLPKLNAGKGKQL